MKIQILFTFLLISSILSLTADDSILSAKYIVFLYPSYFNKINIALK